MLTHGYYCTVCKKGTIKVELWLQHLLEEPHQSLARQACFKWEQELRDRSLVVRCNFPVGDSDMLVKYFSNDESLVSDFVWGPDNPNIAVIQLENMEEFPELVTTKGKIKLLISNDCKVKVDKGMDFTDEQWGFLLEFMMPSIDPLNDIQEPVSFPSHSVANYDNGATPTPFVSTSDLHSSSVPDVSSSLSRSYPYSRKKRLPKRAPNRPRTPTGTGRSANEQLLSIRKSLKVPDEKYNAAQNIVSKLQKVLQTKYEGCSVHIFRNWNLKFKHDYSDHSNYLLIYVTGQIPISEDDPSWKPVTITDEIFGYIKESEELYLREIVITRRNRKKLGIGRKYTFRSNGLAFNLINQKGFLIELQLNRLIKYLCTFDKRCIPLLSLVHYWAKYNGIVFHEKRTLLYNHRVAWNIGEPAALEWMVILFMCRHGLIPTPREVQDRPHRKVPLPGLNVDIGFSDDPEFAMSWKTFYSRTTENEDFGLSVVNLAQQFFELFRKALVSGSWILNTRDGQLLSTYKSIQKGLELPINNPCYPDAVNLLTPEEVSILNNLDQDRNVQKQVRFSDTSMFRVLVVNPLYVGWRLSLSNKKLPRICESMKKTAESLLEYLEIWREEEKKEVEERKGVNLRDYLRP